jgi:D-amino peptidase
MLGDVNAAINGAFVGGVDEVTVADAHHHNRTLSLDGLDVRARLHTGSPTPHGMLAGIDDQPPYNALVFVGYHAMAGAKKAVLCHTWSDTVVAGVWLNGQAVGEIGLNAAVGAYFNLPVIALTGDRVACLEAQTLLGPALEVAVVKQATGRFSAECLPLGESRERICSAVASAVSKLKAGNGPAAWAASAPVIVEVEFYYPEQAERGFLVPGSERRTGTRLAFTAPDMMVAYRAFRAMVGLGRG